MLKFNKQLILIKYISLFILFFFFLKHLFNNIQYIFFFEYNFNILFSLLISTIITEYFYNKSFDNVVFNFDITTFRNLLRSSIITIICFFFIFLIFTFSLKLNFNSTINLKILLSFLLFHLIISISEEIGFRGIIFNILKDHYGNIFAILTTSTIFTFFHLNNPNVNLIAIINIFCGGLLFAFIVDRTGSIWNSIMVHFLWNIITSLFLGSKVSGFNSLNLIKFEVNTFKFFFGNDFGFESSFLAFIAIILLLILFSKYLTISPYIEAKRFKKIYIR